MCIRDSLFRVLHSKFNQIGTLETIATTADKGQNRVEVSQRTLRELQHGVPIRVKQAEVRWFSSSPAPVVDDETILCPILSLTDTPHVFAALRVGRAGSVCRW
eukprot:TRINITY_DN30732_c0_g1_i1.p1 TRINITY_DN30732_c0_g1~~TRINITY_DN30732_c0_g1_i1.p1  ORF type:complete len:103 (+),score=29.56 TRINITY_DN30732_c0_g1_i1:148-456(+)